MYNVWTCCCLETGIPKKGVLGLTYYSGGGCRERGCVPNIRFRQALCNRVVLCDEIVIHDGEENVSREELAVPDPTKAPGYDYYITNMSTGDVALHFFECTGTLTYFIQFCCCVCV